MNARIFTLFCSQILLLQSGQLDLVSVNFLETPLGFRVSLPFDFGWSFLCPLIRSNLWFDPTWFLIVTRFRLCGSLWFHCSFLFSCLVSSLELQVPTLAWLITPAIVVSLRVAGWHTGDSGKSRADRLALDSGKAVVSLVLLEYWHEASNRNRITTDRLGIEASLWLRWNRREPILESSTIIWRKTTICSIIIIQQRAWVSFVKFVPVELQIIIWIIPWKNVEENQFRNDHSACKHVPNFRTFSSDLQISHYHRSMLKISRPIFMVRNVFLLRISVHDCIDRQLSETTPV